MEAKDKAKELLELVKQKDNAFDKKQQKNCALVVCNEILKDYSSYRVKPFLTLSQAIELSKYWQDVKQEIENL